MKRQLIRFIRKVYQLGGHEGVAYTLAEMCNTKTIAMKRIFSN